MIGVASKPRTSREKQPRSWTYDELVASFPESNEPAELWSGELVMPPAPSPIHQDTVFDFATLLRNWVDPRGLGKVYCSPIDMVLAPRRVVQPDVLFVAKKRLQIVKKAVFGAADLVAEVISESSHERDRIKKRDLYEQHGVQEYWLIDREATTVEVLFLTRGEFELIGRWRPGESAHSQLLKGFRLKVGDVLR